MHRISALLGAGALSLTLSACGAPAVTPGTTDPAPAGTTAATSPVETPSATPTPTAAASGYGAWCDALVAQEEALTQTFGFDAGGAAPAQPLERGEQLLWEEGQMCALAFGGDFTSPRFVVNEYRYASAADAAADYELFGVDDGDPMVVTLDQVEVAGLPAWYVTFVNAQGMPPVVSYSATLQQEDRLIRAQFRHAPEGLDALEPGQPPSDEAERRQQVLDAVELLGG